MIAQNVGRLPNSAEKSKKFEKSVAKPLTFKALYGIIIRLSQESSSK